MPNWAARVRSDQHPPCTPGLPSIDARIELPHGPSAPSHARRFVRQALAQWGYQSLSEPVTLLTNELVTNAVLHAGSGVSVMVCVRNGVVRVEVADTSPRMPRDPHYAGDSQTGRGLALVEKVSRTWGATEQRGGKIVWFEVAL